jgi:hypothetical protein
MLPERRMFEDDLCSVSDQLLHELHRSSSRELTELIATVSPEVRAIVALYSYQRAHLHLIGLTIAASCDEYALVSGGGKAGAIVCAISRSPAARTSPAPPWPPEDNVGDGNSTSRALGSVLNKDSRAA